MVAEDEMIAEIDSRAAALRAEEPALTELEAVIRVLLDDPGLPRQYDAARQERARRANDAYQEADRRYIHASQAEQALTEEQDTAPARSRGPRPGTKWTNQGWIDPQVYFLQCVFKVVPEVEAQLREMINLDEAARTKALHKWSRNWHLDTAWCRAKGYTLVTDPSSLWPRPPDFTFQYEGWNPLVQVKAKDVEKRMRTAFDDALKGHFRAMEDHAKRQGWVAPGKMPVLMFFYWAARFQVKGESAERIRDLVWYDVTPPTERGVSEGIEKRVSVELRTRPNEPAYSPYLRACQREVPSRQAVERGYHTVLQLVRLPQRPDIK